MTTRTALWLDPDATFHSLRVTALTADTRTTLTSIRSRDSTINFNSYINY
jgi:hypothetical protein